MSVVTDVKAKAWAQLEDLLREVVVAGRVAALEAKIRAASEGAGRLKRLKFTQHWTNNKVDAMESSGTFDASMDDGNEEIDGIELSTREEASNLIMVE